MSKRVGVIAGHHREFLYYCQGRDPDQRGKFSIAFPNQVTIDDVKYHYISGIESIRGVHFDEVIYYGTYGYRKDLNELKDWLKARGL